MAWFYNEDLLKAAGVTPLSGNPTWDQLTEMLKETTKNGKFGYQVSADARMFTDFLKQAGGEVTNQDATKAAFNTPEGVETLQWLRDMVFKWKVSPNPPLKNGFESGAVAFEYQGSYRIPVYRKLTKIKINAMHTTKNKAPYTMNGGESLVIWKTDTTHEEASWKFIQGMTTKENILEWDIKSGYLPVRKSVLDMSAYKKVVKDDPIRQIFVDELAYGGFWIRSPYGPDVSTVMANQINRVILKDDDVKTVLADMEKQVNNVLAGKKETG